MITRRLAVTGALAPLMIHACASGSPDPVRSAALNEVQQGFSGVVLVGRGDTIAMEEAYGAVRGEATRRDTRFWISSIGKQFISTAVMRCIELGYFDLDSALSRVWPDTPEDKRAITIRHVLSHTSGLPQSYDFEIATNSEEARLQILALPVETAPGGVFSYSNANYALAAAMIERASGANYVAFIQEQLFARARLRNTGQFPADPEPRVAPLPGEPPPRLAQLRWWQAYYSTAHDLFRWRVALWSDAILSESSREALIAPVASIQEGQAALNWFIGVSPRGAQRIFVRGNDDTGQNSLIYYYPGTDITIIVLTHAGYKDDDTSWSRAMLASLEAALEL